MPTFPRAISLLAKDIKLAHSVFALPFAVLGVFLAMPTPDTANNTRVLVGKLALVVLCMVLARTWAMVVNRLADRAIDASNPRTARRAFASGALAPRQGFLALAFCAAGFVGATSLFWFWYHNPWPLALSVPVLAWIGLYSFTKRFTALCHLVLGTALAASPLAAAIAIDPASLARTPALWFLAGFVLCWVAGFDIIYALQDMLIDRAAGLRSIPAALGVPRSVLVSKVLHATALALVILAWKYEPRLQHIFLAAMLLTGCLLAWEHAIVHRMTRAHVTQALHVGTEDNPLPSLTMAFFTLNGVVSIVFGAAGVIDLLRA